MARLTNQRSISAQNDGIAACAQLVATMLHEQGFATEVMPSADVATGCMHFVQGIKHTACIIEGFAN